MKGTPKMEFIYKKFCIYSYMFKLQSPSMYCPFDAIQLLRHFFHCSKQFLNSLVLMPFSASAIFCITSSTLANISLWGDFSSGKKKLPRVRLGNKEDGTQARRHFWSNTKCSLGRGACKSPTMKWGNALKETSKKFTKAERSLSQQHQLVQWYRWVPRTLT